MELVRRSTMGLLVEGKKIHGCLLKNLRDNFYRSMEIMVTNLIDKTDVSSFGSGRRPDKRTTISKDQNSTLHYHPGNCSQLKIACSYTNRN